MIQQLPDNTNLLLLKVAEGNENAFKQLFNTYDHLLKGYIMSITRSEALTQEMVQDVFLKIWMNRNYLTEIDSFKSYLFVIARNHTFDCLKQINRNKRREKEWVYTVGSNAVNDPLEPIPDKAQEKVEEAVKLLPPRQKEIYTLKSEGMKQAEIALELNISVGTVKKHLVLALRFLKNQIRPKISGILEN